jgi:hypothetical protein
MNNLARVDTHRCSPSELYANEVPQMSLLSTRLPQCSLEAYPTKLDARSAGHPAEAITSGAAVAQRRCVPHYLHNVCTRWCRRHCVCVCVYRTGARLQAKGISGLVSEPHSVWHAFAREPLGLYPVNLCAMPGLHVVKSPERSGELGAVAQS